MKHKNEDSNRQVSSFIAIVFLAIFAHICLDYEYTDPHRHMIRVPMGQYFAFFLVLFGACLTLYFSRFSIVLRDKYLTIIVLFLPFVLVLAVASSSDFWNFRLLTIIVIMSASAGVIGFFFKFPWQQLALLFLFIPYLFPIIGAIILEIAGEVSFGVVWRNPKHIEYPIPRWYFMNSYANGFGLDAAISAFSAIFIFLFQKKNIGKIFWAGIFCVSALALFLSGTRAAWLLFFFLIFMCLFSTAKGTKINAIHVILGLVCITILIFLLNSISVNFLRLSSDLNNFSSNRMQGALYLIDAIANCWFLGVGFGEAKDLGDGIPANLFYLGLAYEIGITGAILAVFCLASPFLFLACRLRKKESSSEDFFKHPLDIWCFCIGAGLLFYQLFEFDLLRVSATNLLFFFCFGRILFTLGQLQKQSSAK